MNKLDAFLEKPTPEGYVAALDELAEGEDYTPYAEVIVKLPEMMSEKQFKEILGAVDENAATVALSPAAHYFASIAAGELGNANRAEDERARTMVLLENILGSGNGSKDSPLPVCIIDDEYLILQFLEMQVSKQSLKTHGGRVLDVFEEVEMCFDITRAFRKLPGQSK